MSYAFAVAVPPTGLSVGRVRRAAALVLGSAALAASLWLVVTAVMLMG